MRKLLSANLVRLWKDKIFWICMGSMLIYSVVFMLYNCRLAAANVKSNYCFDDFYFQFAIPIGAFCAVFSSLFLGTEYSDGTIRNKITVGHTRTNIYLSNLLITFFATILMMLVWLIGALVGIPTWGALEMSIFQLACYFSIAIMFIAALSAIFCLLNMLSTNKAITVVLSVILFFILLLFASTINNSLSQPEMIENMKMIVNENGTNIACESEAIGKSIPNPQYIGGTMRTVFEFIYDFLPTGQELQMGFLQIKNPAPMLLSSAFITIASTLCGMLAFRRKDLK